MVGIVLVSHSRKLAEGVKELADQMTQGKVLIEAAGGIDDEQNPIGTDAMRVMGAIEQVYQDDDVLVLMDMGSALMSAEMAIQFLPEEMQDKVHLCSAPIVEGGVAAAVQAMLESGIKAVKQEAENALKSKQQQLNIEDEAAQDEAKSEVKITENSLRFDIVVPNKHGLHARPASKLIQLTKGIEAELQIAKQEANWVNAKSLNNLSLLGAKQGDVLNFSASGAGAKELKNLILKFAEENFGDDDTETISQTPKQKKPISEKNKDGIWGIPSSSGIGIGKSILIKRTKISIPEEKTNNTSEEIEYLQKALQAAREEIISNKKKASASLDKKEAEIFDAHLFFLEDADLLDNVKGSIHNEQQTAIKAWFDATEKIALQYQNSDNAYIRERVADARDIQALVLKYLGVKTELQTNFTEPVILLAQNLQPSETLKLDTKYVKAFVLQEGNENAHTAILARSLGIPAITGLGTSFDQIPTDQELLVNGNTGQILTNPEDKEWQATLEEKAVQEKIAEELKEIAQKSVQTKDGISIHIKANISGLADAKLAKENGADGVGLFRTELYFMNQASLPSESQQYELYSKVSEILEGKPITIRTLDVGGDKPIPYLPIDKEENPFLGLRGIRFTLANQEVFKTQLRAILRTSATNDVSIMFPMISTLNEWHAAKKLLEECKQELSSEGIAYKQDIPCGMMVEVPSVILNAEDFAKEVDFFSIGTNDLSQYMMAVDRGNASVKYLITDLEPSVLEAIRKVGEAAQKYSKPIAVCGELGAKEKVAPFLLKYGIRSLSMNALQIPKIKNSISQISIE